MSDRTPTITYGGTLAIRCPQELMDSYQSLVEDQRLSWTSHHHMLRRLGSGGQGVVFLSERRGADSFTLPVALKIFSPHHYSDSRSYDEDMVRIARIGARVAQIQQDHLLDVNNFIERDRIRIMEMEWIDGYDMRQLLTPRMVEHARERATPEHWKFLTQVIFTPGTYQPRLKPGVAIQILREALAGLTALHREGIVHGDLKPSNIMLKRTGSLKLIDIGSAIELDNIPSRRMCSPAYAAPEVLDDKSIGPQSDLASLGYVLIEMLAGRSPFAGQETFRSLLEAKRMLPQRLPEILPSDVVCNEMLLNLCKRLIAPDPSARFPSAEAANLDREGAASFHRQLVKSNLASEYDNDIRVWLEGLDKTLF
ncbi:Serine/threonine-protein kinase PknL [Planctomycetales bacterium 10988]|nr:Serine/threonine-protein kinase PknL [Planctomycetales bacterium 10988]